MHESLLLLMRCFFQERELAPVLHGPPKLVTYSRKRASEGAVEHPVPEFSEEKYGVNDGRILPLIVIS